MDQNNTYHQYQQILDFQDPNDRGVLKQRRARKKFKKSLDGCLSCKKRRKKCDETKPICLNCTRMRLDCKWPDHVDITLLNPIDTTDSADTAQDDQEEGRSIEEAEAAVQGPGEVTDNDSSEPSMPDLIGKKISQSYPHIQNVNQNINVVDQFLNIQMVNENEPPAEATSDIDLDLGDIGMEFLSSRLDEKFPSPPVNYKIPGIDLDEQDQLCYNRFIDQFIPSITSAYMDDEAFSPLNILTPFAAINTTVREIFFACGAALLCFNNDEFQKLAHDKYVLSVNLLVQDLQHSKTGCEDHLFVSVQLLQTLCLRNKNVGLNATKTALHLSAAYEILKNRKSRAPNGQASVLEKVLAEYFVFNYPITLMLCHHDKLSKHVVPSPFKFFDEMGGFLRTKIVPEGDIWANHPMVGVALGCFELSCKASWLCRLLKRPFSPEDLVTADQLVKQCDLEMAKLEEYKTKDVKKLISISFARTHIYGCRIMLSKICDWSITIEAVQPLVDQMIEEFKTQIDLHSISNPNDDGPILSLWGLFVCGSSSSTIKQREFVTQAFLKMATKTGSIPALKILKYFNIVWNDDLSKLNDESIGFDFLFDTTVLDIVCT